MLAMVEWSVSGQKPTNNNEADIFFSPKFAEAF